jgi:hypothetical protein
MRFIVEAYQPPSIDSATTTRWARLEGSGPTSVRRPVRYLETIYVPEDEVCLHFFDADSVETLEQALGCAALPYERIVAATMWPDRDPDGGIRS